MKFALNAAHDTLPHNANLQLWKKKDNAACPLCGERQRLLHVLNCKVARNLRRYNQHHDAILQEIVKVLQPKLSPTTRLTADLGDGYEFPTHIVPKDLCPDIVWWDDQQKSLMLAELTISCYAAVCGIHAEREGRYKPPIFWGR